jgi:hypothetical protein
MNKDIKNFENPLERQAADPPYLKFWFHPTIQAGSSPNVEYV